jgi:hypothetical protein
MIAVDTNILARFGSFDYRRYVRRVRRSSRRATEFAVLSCFAFARAPLQKAG